MFLATRYNAYSYSVYVIATHGMVCQNLSIPYEILRTYGVKGTHSNTCLKGHI